MSTPAIDANSSPAFISCSVQVGDLNSNVSETIAESINPAIFAGISMLFSLKILFKIVAVQPTGSAR
ncbi:hypothetical protein D3C79_1022630 [compost metagenome]